MLFTTPVYNGQNSWLGRIAGVAMALALSSMVVAMYYYGAKLVHIAVSLRAPDAPVAYQARPAPRTFTKSTIPGTVSVQIMSESKPGASNGRP